MRSPPPATSSAVAAAPRSPGAATGPARWTTRPWPRCSPGWMSAEELTSSPQLGAPEHKLSDGPVVIEVREVEKTFQLPKQRVDSLKERALHPFRKGEYKELHALDRVS